MRPLKRCPVHPGEILREDYMKPLGLTVTRLSEIVGVSRKTFSKIINGKGAVTPEMALRLSRAFDTSPDLWLNLQKNYDLWRAEHASSAWKEVKPVVYLTARS